MSDAQKTKAYTERMIKAVRAVETKLGQYHELEPEFKELIEVLSLALEKGATLAQENTWLRSEYNTLFRAVETVRDQVDPEAKGRFTEGLN